MAEFATSGPLQRSWNVAALLLAVSDALAVRFGALSVQGELSGFARAASGHCYFNLKDADGAAASLRCAMFRRAASMLEFAPADGARVEVRGRLALYEPRGELQFVVESMRALGAGSLYEQFLRLKARLEAQGLFDAGRKRALPAWPRAVGVVSSTAGAALHDIVTTLARRAPQVAVVVYPSLVQGPEAPAALVRAIELAGQRAEVDVLIVARGGGSIEDLWAFNDEAVVRAVAACPIPTLSGVGHETDVTLTDFAADRRAATPTAAAEMAAPARDVALEQLAALAERLRSRVHRRLDGEAQRLDQRALQLSRPAQALARAARQLDALQARGQRALAQALERTRARPPLLAHRLQAALRADLARRLERCAAWGGRLSGLDPHRVLARGYAWVTDAAARPVTSAAAVQPGQPLVAVWHDGAVHMHADAPARKPA
ncbi:MAG TPA: exodeoxyribonuclease VII large subunit [Burkholderiaceae bacterium]|nr:exodeoxyribonuclease VII large subunit [Burkholderiaceae bacterium]